MDHRIDDGIDTGGGASHTISTPATEEAIAGTDHGSLKVNQTPRHVIQMGRDGSNPGGTGISIRSTWDHYPVMIVSTPVYQVAFILLG